MKRNCLLTAAALLSAGLLVLGGCSKKAGAAASATPGSASAKAPTHIIFYCWDDVSLKPMVDAFNKAQSDIVVDANYLPSTDYETKITTLLTGHTEMDCYMEKRQADMFPHEANGFLMPLDDLIAKTGVNHEAVDNYKDSVTINGKVYGFPWRGAAYYTYFNRAIFKKFNQPTPDTYVKAGTWTWDKFAEVAKKVSSGDGKIYGSSIYFWGNSQLLMEAQHKRQEIEQDGTVDYDDAALRQLTIRRDLERAKAMYPLIDMKVNKVHYSKQFYDGQIAMLLIGEWFPGQVLDGSKKGLLKGFTLNDFGVTRLPCDDTKNYVTMGTPTWNSITSYAKHPEAAMKFIAWMGGPEGAKMAAQAGVLPAVTNADVDKILATSIPDPTSLQYFVEKKYSYPLGTTKYGSRLQALYETQLVDPYLLGKTTDAQFMSQLKAGIEQIIKTTN
jgi:multiple sugar transport system substrate-binding protein